MRASQSDLRNHSVVLGGCEDVDPVELEKPGEVPVELIEDQKLAPLELFNDLKAAVEANSSKGRSVLYPGKSMKFDDMPLELWHGRLEFHRKGRCLGTKRAKAGRAADPGACKEGILGGLGAFHEMKLLLLGHIAGVAGDLPHCFARKLRHSLINTLMN